LRDYTKPLYGHTVEENQGAQVGHATVLAQVAAASVWNVAALIRAAPALVSSALAWGQGAFASILPTSLGGGLGIGALVPSSVGGYIGVGALGSTVVAVGIGIENFAEKGVFGPLSDWFFAKSYDPFAGNRRGSYWASGKKVFPTSRTTLESRRVRGKGRGGVTKWDTPEDLDLEAAQRAWIQNRYKELVEGQGLSREMARKIIEGQILQQKRSPLGPLKRILDEIFGS
jgi:hypothetical protein